MELEDELLTLRRGALGPQTELFQLALKRAGFPVVIDGIFGSETLAALKDFQSSSNLITDGIVGPKTWRELTPYLVGFTVHTVVPGDTLWKLARRYRSSVSAVQTANPGVDPQSLQVAHRLTIPLGFDVVPDNISFTSTVLAICIRGLHARYPFIGVGEIGKSVMGRPLYRLEIGEGANSVFYNAAHHANEWITSPLLLQFLESYAQKVAFGGKFLDVDARNIYTQTVLSLVPMVNPDGVDLVTGQLNSGDYYRQAEILAQNYPAIAFPRGWKANIDGIDLNLQYPAGWENARDIKYAQGFDQPGPRDFVGLAPLNTPESRAVYDWTRSNNFSLTLSFHTQGKVIYWKYLDFEPKNAYVIAQKFSFVSGYEIAETPYMSGFAGYKDWFIAEYDQPGYTIEAGEGVSPLPLSQFTQIYQDCLGIMALGLSPEVGLSPS